MSNEQQFCLFGQIQTSQTGGQLYSNTSPYGERSLDKWMKIFLLGGRKGAAVLCELLQQELGAGHKGPMVSFYLHGLYSLLSMSIWFLTSLYKPNLRPALIVPLYKVFILFLLINCQVEMSSARGR